MYGWDWKITRDNNINNGKFISIQIVIILVLSTILFLPSSASAEMDRPVWTEGDFWRYEALLIDEGYDIPGERYDEVKMQTTLEIDSQYYKARIVTTQIEWFYLDMTSIKLDRIYYYGETDNLLMKLVLDSPSMGRQEDLLNPPFTGIDYPISVGKEWECHTTSTVSNSVDTWIEDVDIYYNCTGITEINTRAGLFSCYVFKAWSEGEEMTNYSMQYFSPEVGGRYVYREEYTNGTKDYQEKLIGFDYTGIKNNDDPGDPSDSNDSPGYGIVFISCAIVIGAFIRKGYIRNR